MTGKDAIAGLPNRIDAVGAGLTTNVAVFGNNVSKPAPSPPQSGKNNPTQMTGKWERGGFIKLNGELHQFVVKPAPTEDAQK
jgi:hypothetical protein